MSSVFNDSPLHVWVAQVPAQLCFAEVEPSLDSLPAPLVAHIRKFLLGRDRLLRLAGLKLVVHGLSCVAGFAPARTYAALSCTTQGRPELINMPLHSPWQVSFSYAYPWLTCALRCGPSQVPVGEALNAPGTPVYAKPAQNGLGIDIERNDAASPLLTRPAAHFAHVFSPAEQEAMRSPVSSSDIAQRWTLKEAVLKAMGTGFSENPQNIDTCPQPASSNASAVQHCLQPRICTQQPLHSLRYNQHLVFWQSIPFAQGWITIADLAPWQRVEISFLRLIQKEHTLEVL